MRRYSTITAFVLAASLMAVARADIWKWVDAVGVVHYSDRPVPGAVLIKGRDPVADASVEDGGDQKKSDASEPISAELSKEAAQRAVEKDETAARADQCKQAKDHYTKLIQARRLYNTDSNGQRQYLTDQQADQERVQARIDMNTACGTDTQ